MPGRILSRLATSIRRAVYGSRTAYGSRRLPRQRLCEVYEGDSPYAGACRWHVASWLDDSVFGELVHASDAEAEFTDEELRDGCFDRQTDKQTNNSK